MSDEKNKCYRIEVDELQRQWIAGRIDYYLENGFRKTVKKFGWKLFAIIFLYYLIRDSILYIIIPYFALKGIFNF